MRIFRQGNRIRIQLKDNKTEVMLINFSVLDSVYEELRQHMIQSLEASPIDKLR